MQVLNLTDLDIKGKKILIREDLNVPIREGRVMSDARLIAALPTIRWAMGQDAAIILLSHLGRPTEGEYSEENSLAPVAERLGGLLEKEVRLEKDYLDGLNIKPGEIVLCENVRFNKGEADDDESLGKKYAALCDVFVMDAFATAHRAQASTHAVARFAPRACAGPLLAGELEALTSLASDPKKPTVAIIGGAKVSTKLTVLESLSDKMDTLIVGGGIANNFIKAMGYEIGKSLYEPKLLDAAKDILAKAEKGGAKIPLPTDVVVGTEFSEDSPATVKKVSEVGKEDMILDVGPETAIAYTEVLSKAGTIIWNGPLGAFELDKFSRGTESLVKAIAASPAFSAAGGGDTLAAIDIYGVRNRISYLSTGGGAFLRFLEGKKLPAVAVLEERFLADEE